MLPLVGRGEAPEGVPVLVPHGVGLGGRSPALLVHAGVAAVVRAGAVEVVRVEHGLHHS